MPDIAQIFLIGFKSLPQDDQQEVVTFLCEDPIANSMILHRLQIPTREKHLNKLKDYGSTSTRTSSKKLIYDGAGRLSGQIRGRQVSVFQDARRRFRSTIDGIEFLRLPMELVEFDLDLKVNRQRDGTNSETHARAIYRHFVDRYNEGDKTVNYEPPSSQ